MQCELCGKECGDRGKIAIVDGVQMLLCPSCLKYAQSVKQEDIPPVLKQRLLKRVHRTSKTKDIYEKMDKELIPDWHVVIRNAREKKGFSREELGFRIGERTVTIAKIENGELRPSDDIARKLEKQLDIKLFEEVEKISLSQNRGTATQGFTLGDFIKKE